MLRRIAISSNDFGLFDAELNSYEYEYFCKHIGAFKRFMQDEPKEQRQLFVDAFCEYSYNHVEIKAIATMSDPKKKFIESFRQYAQECFINGRFNTAKQFLNDSVIVARNKHMIQYMDSHSYAKDPFFHKETRDVFRRLFGEPTEAGTCVKVICVLPLYVRFAGSICRYLKKWLDMEESLYPMPVKNKKSKAEKKAMREQALAKTIPQATKRTSTLKTASTNQRDSAKIGQKCTPSTGRKTVAVPSSTEQNGPATTNQKNAAVASTNQKPTPVSSSSKTLSSDQKITPAAVSSKTVHEDEQSQVTVATVENKSTQNEDADDADDFPGFYYDMHERKQRKRDFRKKGKKHPENIACQHPCHGKVCNCSPHKCNHTNDHPQHDQHVQDHHDDNHDNHSNHDHNNYQDESQPQATREELMNCLCQKHKRMAVAKLLEKKAALEKHLQDEVKKISDKSLEVDRIPAVKTDQNESSVVKFSDNTSSDAINPGVQAFEEKIVYKNMPEETNSEARYLANKTSQTRVNHSEGKSPEDKNSESDSAEGEDLGDNNLADKIVDNISSEKDNYLGESSVDKNSECISCEDKRSDGKTAENKEVILTETIKSPRGKNSCKKVRENGLVSSDDSSDCDAAVERFVRRNFPELHLCEPHPNVKYEELLAREKEAIVKESKLRTCAFCRKQETEVKTFKKCQKCKGKGTKFYCSRDCQKLDWTKHRLEH